ncbi:MAG TPA: hypothetical protein VE954_22630 [Oligoflexus sp.]|uniref:hypothetical protein n=1 Tax=Oligoflexus sp. TaxID=1971216 RepID=UPI002D6C3367|nr:hypothetical protein [Oligoflexus sp.]HYX35906.1 hypothetical protein [Oligoflexus sp.]
MIEERRSLEKDCEELNEAVRKAVLLNLDVFLHEQKKREAAAWQAAWIHWNVNLEDTHPHASTSDHGASSKMGPSVA